MSLERGHELPPCSSSSSWILSAVFHCHVSTYTVEGRGISEMKGNLLAGGGRNFSFSRDLLNTGRIFEYKGEGHVQHN